MRLDTRTAPLLVSCLQATTFTSNRAKHRHQQSNWDRYFHPATRQIQCQPTQTTHDCWWKVATTQYSVYVAFSNLGRSMRAGLYAGTSEQVSYVQVMQITVIGLILSALVLIAFHQDRQQQAIMALDMVALDTAPPPKA